ncbi:MAG: hypothetical protein ACREFY_00610 [Acetobacteraceae bacterium]
MADRAIAIGTLGRRHGCVIETSGSHERTGLLAPPAWHGLFCRRNMANAATRGFVRCVRGLRSALDQAPALLRAAALGRVPGRTGSATHDLCRTFPSIANMPADTNPPKYRTFLYFDRLVSRAGLPRGDKRRPRAKRRSCRLPLTHSPWLNIKGGRYDRPLIAALLGAA